jgi:LmbE family N-acetylglucosaminyl deacetylase
VEGEPHRAAATLFYAIHHTQERPACVVDVTGEWEDKIRALKAFRSQLHNPEYEGEATYVASEAFWSSITQRAAYWGSWIGVDYGEPLFSEGPLRMEGIPGVTS